MSAVLSHQQAIAALKWRYATKGFDPNQKIGPVEWKALEQALVLTPSSYGLQPWKFLVITDPATRAKLLPLSWNQKQVVDASHYVVLLAKNEIDASDVDKLIARTASLRGIDSGAIAFYRDMMMGDLVKGPRHAVIGERAARQVYIALGNLMTTAAVLGIDACPMEGIDPARYDEVLGLKGSGYRTVVACALGYRSKEDKYASLPKVRYEADELIRRI